MGSPSHGEHVTLGPAVEPRVGVVSLLTLWLVLLYGVSASQVLGPLGAIGQPAFLVSLVLPAVWLAAWLLPESGIARGPNPMRAPLLLYFGFMLLSYSVAHARPLTELEMTGSLRALLVALAHTGVALVALDGPSSAGQVDRLVRRLVLVGAAMSALGILQFFSGLGLQPTIPGLEWMAGEAPDVGARSVLNRPSATAMHPIELSVVTAALLPLAIHLCLYERDPHRRRNNITAAVIIGFAMPLAVSRSGIVSIFVGLAVLALGWDWRRRLIGLAATMVAVPALWMVVPGLVGTFRSMFLGAEHDPSITARQERVPRIMETIRERPWLGRGNGTWSVDEYFLIDNEVWVTTIETGIVGIVLTFALFLFGALVASAVGALPGIDDRAAHLGQAVAAGIAALAVSLFTFDAFHYRILTGTLFLLLGLAGAMWRLHRPAAEPTVDQVIHAGRDSVVSEERPAATRRAEPLPAAGLIANPNPDR